MGCVCMCVPVMLADLGNCIFCSKEVKLVCEEGREYFVILQSLQNNHTHNASSCSTVLLMSRDFISNIIRGNSTIDFKLSLVTMIMFPALLLIVVENILYGLGSLVA